MNPTEREPDRELTELSARIASVRAEVDELRAHRERIESALAPRDAADEANDELRQKVAAARSRLAELARMREKAAPSLEASLRSSLTFAGASIALPGAITLGAMLRQSRAHPEQELDTTLYLVVAAPLILGLALLLRARFAKFRPGRQDLDGDFL